jgi:putative flippase GtrA
LRAPPWLTHWLKFNAVGAIGIVVQLAALWILTRRLHVEYLIATTLAVEIAVLHNFLWHDRWTWAERVRAKGDRRMLAVRLARFNLSTGAVSIASNLLLMRLLVGQIHVPVLAANMLSIVVTSVANFLLSDRFAFRK